MRQQNVRSDSTKDSAGTLPIYMYSNGRSVRRPVHFDFADNLNIDDINEHGDAQPPSGEYTNEDRDLELTLDDAETIAIVSCPSEP